MQEEDETTNGPIYFVRELGGRRVYKAQRLSSGNWLLIETNGASRLTVNNQRFSGGYERVPDDDRQAG